MGTKYNIPCRETRSHHVTITMSSFGRRAKEAFSIPITTFPESLHPLLKEIDGPDGNGSLETDELTEVFEMYAAAKKANEEGCISPTGTSENVAGIRRGRRR